MNNQIFIIYHMVYIRRIVKKYGKMKRRGTKSNPRTGCSEKSGSF